jgi:hypothetical protein
VPLSFGKGGLVDRGCRRGGCASLTDCGNESPDAGDFREAGDLELDTKDWASFIFL